MVSDKTKLVKDLAAKKITVTREFTARPELVWRAWTEKELLEKWWAPKPWHVETKEFDFRVGGHWLYAMVGPNSERHWSRSDFTVIDPQKSFSAKDYFCDENGKPNNSMVLDLPEGKKEIKDLPVMHWKNTFENLAIATRVTVVIDFASEADIQKILDTGFEEGFNGSLSNLDEVLENMQK